MLRGGFNSMVQNVLDLQKTWQLQLNVHMCKDHMKDFSLISWRVLPVWTCQGPMVWFSIGPLHRSGLWRRMGENRGAGVLVLVSERRKIEEMQTPSLLFCYCPTPAPQPCPKSWFSHATWNLFIHSGFYFVKSWTDIYHVIALTTRAIFSDQTGNKPGLKSEFCFCYSIQLHS